ncbi:site-specific DNA-methyltransferase [Pseudomonas pharyngis]|uniref:site-specific DNA-methyltransferase n=1 Tax=Pseudomonas pharyngis TaxID=2892333 RepID=UPI003FD26D76
MTNNLIRTISRIATSINLETQLSFEFDKLEDRAPIEFKLNDTNCTLLKGDNLDSLIEISKTNLTPVDLCYIDPPYNTKNKFIYNDSRTGGLSDFFGTHSAWMSFMLPRLVIAHSLLSEAGFIAVSIDDYEQPYLRLLLDKIFGEDNFIGNIVVCRSKNGKGSNKGIAVNHDYVVIYSKSKKSEIIGLGDDESKYNQEDMHGRYKVDGLFRKKGDASKREDRPNMFYPLYYDTLGRVFSKRTHKDQKEVFPLDSKGIERRWLWGPEKAAQDAWKLYASKSGVIYVKNYSHHDKKIKVRSIWSDNKYLTDRATIEAKEIFGEKIFETPKPIGLIEDLIGSLSRKDAVILDFFAGTGTTAHAALNLNLVDGGNRKVILAEQNIEIPKTHIAFEFGHRKISDITETRLKYLSRIHPLYKYQSIEI